MAGVENLLRELRRRRVFRVAIVYAAVAFILWQAAEILVPALNLPDWTLTFVVFITILGAPIALVLGWAFDITPVGVRRTEPAHGSSTVRWRVPRWLVRVETMALVLAGIFLLVWSPWKRTDPLIAAADLSFVDSLAVLPIENRTDDPRLDNLAAAITDQIVSRLKRVGSLKVTDPYSVEQLEGFTTRQLADSLQVAKLVLGNLYSSASGVSLSLRLSDGSGTVLNTWRYDDDPTAGFESAIRLAHAFVSEYLDDSRIHMSASVETPSPQGPGYEKYLVGRTSLGRRTPEGIARARAAFSESLEINPSYAFAYAGLSRVYTLADLYRYRTDATGYETAGLALAFADRAIELEPDLAYAYTARLLLARRSSAPSEQVAVDCERTMELEPANADALSWCAQTLIQRGSVDLGFQTAEQGVALNPQNAGLRMALAYVALALGRHERAADEARMSWQLEPGLMLPRAVEGWSRLLCGQPQRCISIDLGPFEIVRATCLHALGQTREADAIVDSIVGRLQTGALHDTVFTNVVHLEALAVHYAWLGDTRQSLHWLRRAFEASPTGVESRVLQSALFDAVRSDPTFAREVQSIQSGIWPRVEQAGRIAYREYFTRAQIDLPALTGTTGSQPSATRIIVVLPFENLGRPVDDYFADGVTDEITSRLASSSGFSVISRTSAMRYKNSDKGVHQIGLELGVEYVLEGTVRWEHSEDGPVHVFVTPQLVRVSDDTHIWAARYDRVLGGVVAVQSDIAQVVVEALRHNLLEGEQ